MFKTFKNKLQQHWVNFNQTWHKAPFGKGDSKIFSKGVNQELLKNFDKFKNLLMENHVARRAGTCVETSSGTVDSS